MDLKMNGKAESQSTKSRRDGKKRMKDKRRRVVILIAPTSGWPHSYKAVGLSRLPLCLYLSLRFPVVFHPNRARLLHPRPLSDPTSTSNTLIPFQIHTYNRIQNDWWQVRRQGQRHQGPSIPLVPSWSHFPLRSCAPSAPQGQLRSTRRCR
ncbi:hypothetical protein VTN49DRAFT_1547 [Thermomyces lanuginosus]|uniref:uncharacterized protein n=1 Tax=Thermomyces lanuginosus TaxID=5541 RepID=UPI00374418A3